MQKIATFLLTGTLALTAPSLFAADETRYITDDLTTYVFAGAGSNFRITGSVSSGEKVTLIEESPGKKYGLIQLENGRQHWIPLNQLVKEPSLRTQVPILKQQVETLTHELATINDSWNKKTVDLQNQTENDASTIRELRKENDQLNNEIKKLQKHLDDMTLQLDDKQRSIIQQWFMYGGGVAGAGLLLGLILPHIIPRRKKHDRWMK